MGNSNSVPQVTSGGKALPFVFCIALGCESDRRKPLVVQSSSLDSFSVRFSVRGVRPGPESTFTGMRGTRWMRNLWLDCCIVANNTGDSRRGAEWPCESRTPFLG